MHIRHSFSISNKETTIEQFQRFVRNNPQLLPAIPNSVESPAVPQTLVSWYHAAAYCNWLSKEEGISESQWCYQTNDQGQYAAGMRVAGNATERRGYRLPTEKEWEYACRAGTTTPRFFGRADTYCDKYMVSATGPQPKPTGVGLCKPNDFGLFDMLGNIAEWCHDPYMADTLNIRPSDPQDNLELVTDSESRVVRGGSYFDAPNRLRCAARSHAFVANQSTYVGFRVARNYP